jgi:serine protease Do
VIRRRWLLLLPAAAVAGLAPAVAVLNHQSAAPVAQTDAFAASAPVPSVQAPQSVDSSRRTAIVRAAERVAPAVVSVNVVRRETLQPRSLWESFFMPPNLSRNVAGLGSGFITDPQGLVLTNEHVVRGATELVVTLPDGRDLGADLVGFDEVTDLALLRLRDVSGPLPVAPLGTSSNLIIGEWVVAIGNPFGFMLANAEATVTAGVISGVNRNIIPEGRGEGGWYLDMIQTDASINPGNSGGPLVNALGEVIGVNSSIISGSGGSVGLGFAIPIDRARRVANDLLKEYRVRRAWVGIEVVPHEPNRWGRSRRVRVARVAPGSPGAAAGVEPGMLIERVAGRSVASPLDWEARLLDTRVGDVVELDVRQDGRLRTIRVNASDLPSLGAERVTALERFELITLTPAIRAERHLTSEQGALIDRLPPAGVNVGLREGDLIVMINRVQVSTAEEVASMLARLGGTRSAVRVIVERQGQLISVSFMIS